MTRGQSSATTMEQTKALEWDFQEYTWVQLLEMTMELEMERLKVVQLAHQLHKLEMLLELPWG